MSKSRDIADSATTINFIDGVTSNVQTQLNTATSAIAANTTAIANISVTNGTQTKTYASGETSTIALSAAITSGVPVVSVTKEVPQTGLTDNTWDVASDGANYDFENSAYSTTLTPSNASADGVFTLGSGSFAATDLGKIVSGNGGTAVIIKTDGSYNLLTNFTNTSTIASGSWTLKKLIVDGDATGIALSSGADEEGGVVYAFSNTAYTGTTFSVASQDGNAQGLGFNNDGTKMYMVGQASQAVHQYTLSTAFSISTASYDSVSLSVSSQETYPTGLCFNNDGTKMYVVGRTSDSVHQYTLSTAFDLSTASYASLSVSVAGEATNPQDVALSNDGTKMYITDRVSNLVTQWTLSTAFNVSTASYAYSNFSVASQGTAAQGAAFSSDGSIVYVTCNSNDTVFQYNLLTPFVLNNGFYSGISVDITSQGSDVTGVVFNSDQSKMYTIAGGDKINEYSLDPLFNVKSADYMGNSFSVASQSADSTGLAFNNDGTKMYVAGYNSASVYQYTLSTAFDAATASYDSVSLSISSQGTTPASLTFNNDGTKMFISFYNNGVFQYTLSTAFNLSTASYANKYFNAGSQEIYPTGLAFNNDGTKMYVSGFDSDKVHQYTLSTSFDVSTASYDSVNFSFASQDATPTGLAFNATGTKMFITGYTNRSVYQYTLSTAFSVSTASYDNVNLSIASQETQPYEVVFNNDGSKMYIVGLVSDKVHEYEMGGGFSLKTVQYSGDSFSVASQETGPTAVAFNTDGTKMYVSGTSPSSIFQYTLSTAFSVSTASYGSVSFSVSSQDLDPQGLAFNNDGTKMYVVGSGSDTVYQYTLATAFDLSTASYASLSFSVASQEAFPTELAFNNDGTKMYVIGDANNSVFQYSLSTAFDVSTASYDSVSFSVSSQDSDPQGLAFNTDGTKMYVVGRTTYTVYRYTLSTAFNLSTASYDSVSFSVASQETGPNGLAFNTDGTRMYTVGIVNDTVYQYNIGSILVQTPVVYSSDYAVAVTNSGGQINTTYWTDINSTAATEAVGTGEVYYAYSTDAHVTWKIIDNTNGQRSIVRDNTGTWQYNSNGTYGSETWANATTNTEFAALRQAMEGASGLTGQFDVSTVVYSQNLSVSAQDTVPEGIAFNTDGTKMFIVGSTGDDVNEYALSTGFDVSTASFTDSFAVLAQDTVPQGLAFNTNGTKMFIVGSTGDDVNEYTLTTGFDVSTASYSQNFSVVAQDNRPYGIAFNADGTKMFVVGNTAAKVMEYTLSTGFDVSTASFVDSFSVNSQDSQPQGLAFNTDGTKMLLMVTTPIRFTSTHYQRALTYLPLHLLLAFLYLKTRRVVWRRCWED
jgi:DNA-binding beta-propeller fold protein YncE